MLKFPPTGAWLFIVAITVAPAPISSQVGTRATIETRMNAVAPVLLIQIVPIGNCASIPETPDVGALVVTTTVGGFGARTPKYDSSFCGETVINYSLNL